MTTIYKSTVAELLNYVMNMEEQHYEETLDAHGVDSDITRNHAYAKARDLWTELEMDFSNDTPVTFVGSKGE